MPTSAAFALGGVPHRGVFRTAAAVAQPATSDATAYLHMGTTRAATPNPMGRPAYQKAGIKRIQYDTLHAAAMPAGPQGSATMNNNAVTAASIRVQRSQRPGFPSER